MGSRRGKAYKEGKGMAVLLGFRGKIRVAGVRVGGEGGWVQDVEGSWKLGRGD